MKRIATLAVGALFIALAGFGVACKGGGGGLSLADYFQKMDEIQNDNDAELATKEASVQEPAAGASGEEIANLMEDIIAGFAESLRHTADRADALKPPKEVANEHDDMVNAINKAADSLDSTADAVPATLTMEQFQDPAALFGQDVTAAFDDLTTACNALEQIATDHDITVDLACSE